MVRRLPEGDVVEIRRVTVTTTKKEARAELDECTRLSVTGITLANTDRHYEYAENTGIPEEEWSAGIPST